jgi:hypothetical protein
MPFAASCFIFNLALFSPGSGFFSDRGGGGYPAADPVAAGIAGEDYDRKDPSPDSAIGMPTSQSFSSLEFFFLTSRFFLRYQTIMSAAERQEWSIRTSCSEAFGLMSIIGTQM